jgi:sec-independent protein translocase protein TatA
MGLDNPIHIAFLLILLLLVFGAKRLPEMGKSLGTGMRGFKDALSGEDGQSPFATHQHPTVAQPVTVPQQVAVVQPVPAPAQATVAQQQDGVAATPAAQIVPEQVRERIPA